MRKSKLISILSTLSRHEFKWFQAYIESPFNNKNQTVLTLFNTIKKHYPDFEEDRVNMEKVFPKVFPGDKFEEQKLRYAMTDLTKLLENYLVWIEFDKNTAYKKHLMLKSYDSRKLDKYFHTTLEESKSYQHSYPYRDVNYYFNQHLIEEDEYIHALSLSPRSITNSLQKAVDNLDLYYLSNRLRYSCAILNRQGLLQETYNNLFLEEILNFLAKTNLEDIPSISIYHRISMMYVEPEEADHYRKLKFLLQEYSNQFLDEEVNDMYTHALSYCARKINAGRLEFQDEMLSLYKDLISKRLIYDSGFISPNKFKNIVTLALRNDELEWTEEFIEEYKDKIAPEFRQSAYIYNLANLLYFRQQYSKSLKKLQTLEINDIYYHLDAKALLLKTYYQLEETEPFFSLTDAFGNYLKRNKQISENQRLAYLNFVKYTRKLMQLRLGSAKLNIDSVRKELHELSAITNLHWLAEKLDEIAAEAGHK
jgi:hypothetical protein